MSSSGWAFDRGCVGGGTRHSGRTAFARVAVVAVLSVWAILASAISAQAQTVTTGPPVAVTTTGAIVSITFNPEGQTVGYQVLVGPSGGPLTSAEGFLTGPFSGTDDVNETVNLTNLTPNTSYTYQAEVVEFDNDATTDGATGTFTTASLPTGPGTPLIPPQNPDADGIFGFCSSDAECLADANGVRAAQEGLPAIALPSNWSTLTGPEQLFVYTDLERTSRGETAIPNLVNSYDGDVQTGVQNDADPDLSIFPNGNATSIWAGSFPTPLGALYGWLYNDGPGSANLDCTTATAVGCWGHRDNILDNPGGIIGNPTEMDAVVGPDNNGNTGYAALFVNNPSPTPAANVVFSWASEQPFLAAPPLGGLVPHGRAPEDSHLAFGKSTFVAAAGHKVPAVILNTQVKEKAGTLVSYSDSQAAVTTFTVDQTLSGVISKGRCVAAPAHARKHETACIRHHTLGSFAHADAAGTNRFRFMGRLNGAELKPGPYLMLASPRNRAGLSGATVRQVFEVVR